MKIKIKEDAYVYADMFDNKTRDFLKENAGKFVTVDTSYVFDDQYNVGEYRIFDSMITEVVDDVRVNLSKCNYCGKLLPKGETCNRRDECASYGMEDLSESFFVKYPKGIPTFDIKPTKVGYYKLERARFDDSIYLLNSARYHYRFTYDPETDLFYTANGIGYRKFKSLPVPKKICDKVRKILQKKWELQK